MGDNPSEFKACGANCPVDSVSWDLAQEFIKKLNVLTKKKYRLPTEAEFEYAARSGGKNEKWSGGGSETDPKEYAWFSENSNDSTHPVGQKKSNGLGLFDMTGNVREWCQDWYHEKFYTRSPKDNPVSSEDADRRIQRGGSYADNMFYITTTSRRHNAPSYDNSNVGLRLALPVK
jgi:formylglycine-generating enzyme required for sulfatase activity